MIFSKLITNIFGFLNCDFCIRSLSTDVLAMYERRIRYNRDRYNGV
jgi:hypothetical protein